MMVSRPEKRPPNVSEYACLSAFHGDLVSYFQLWRFMERERNEYNALIHIVEK